MAELHIIVLSVWEWLVRCMMLKNHPAAKHACLGRSSVGQQ